MSRGKILLRKVPYTVQPNGGQNSIRIVLSPVCHLRAGERVYQFMKPNGVVELVPEHLVNLDDYI